MITKSFHRLTRMSTRFRQTLGIVFAIVLLDPSLSKLRCQRFEIAVSPSARAEPVTGRVYVAISRSLGRQTPIEQTGETGVPLFAVNVSV